MSFAPRCGFAHSRCEATFSLFAVVLYLSPLLPCFAGLGSKCPWKVQSLQLRGHVALSASRRDVLLGGALSQTELQKVKPICEVPLHRLKPVDGQVGGQFASISAVLGGESVELMLDTGLSEGMVTPSLAKKLKLQPIGSAEGATAGGDATVQLVQLKDLTLECGELLEPVTAAVASFPEEKIDQKWSLNGMLGYQALQSYDADIDFPRGKLRLWRPGEGAAVAAQAGLANVEAVVLPDFAILGVRVMQPESRAAAALGVIDTGAGFSAITPSAAVALKARAGKQAVTIVGVDGRPLQMPLTSEVTLPLGGKELPGGGWETAVSLKTTSAALGDLPALQIFANGKPAVLLGLDVLGKRRLVFAAGSGPKRQLFIGPDETR
ncbi:unnamed protein product [Durusdinium trenchii]|uniref:Aspartyl protease n=2 Tax=Durusdinium trenchii TaxID=1381693 RepID=A0ABP0LLT2_9DINO